MNLRMRVFFPAILATIGVAASLSGCQSFPEAAAASAPAATAEASSAGGIESAFAALERTHDARLGVAAIDTGSGRTVVHRSDERFAFASTNKTFIAAATLQKLNEAELDTVVHFTHADLIVNAPITSRFVDTGMSVRELLDAMLRFSDNTAANLLVARLGGPGAIEEWLRGIGDRKTNVDRLEPELNEATPGDGRDTTTPAQFAADVRKVVLGRSLDVTDRTLLRNMMLHNTTGNGTVRAGVDPAWPVADKTGTGEYGVRNDVAIVYPANHAPIIIVAMTSKDSPDAVPDDRLLAAATEIAIDSLQR